jgi:predicted RNA-binding Zn-ribbon protein involved in translation (DUF1610 family)
MAALLLLVSVPHRLLPGNLLACLIPAVLVFLGVSSARATNFPCPRCGRRFAMRSSWSRSLDNLLVGHCVHCGIALGTPKQDPDARDAEGRKTFSAYIA